VQELGDDLTKALGFFEVGDVRALLEHDPLRSGNPVVDCLRALRDDLAVAADGHERGDVNLT
jgi:hypothetical protein